MVINQLVLFCFRHSVKGVVLALQFPFKPAINNKNEFSKFENNCHTDYYQVCLQQFEILEKLRGGGLSDKITHLLYEVLVV